MYTLSLQMLMSLCKNDLKLIKKYTLILLENTLFPFHKGTNEFVYKTLVIQSVVIWNKIIDNINVNISLFRVKYVLKDFLVLNDISF